MLDRKISESKRIAVLSQGKADGSDMEAVRYKGTFQKIFLPKGFCLRLEKAEPLQRKWFCKDKKDCQQAKWKAGK